MRTNAVIVACLALTVQQGFARTAWFDPSQNEPEAPYFDELLAALNYASFNGTEQGQVFMWGSCDEVLPIDLVYSGSIINEAAPFLMRTMIAQRFPAGMTDVTITGIEFVPHEDADDPEFLESYNPALYSRAVHVSTEFHFNQCIFNSLLLGVSYTDGIHCVYEEFMEPALTIDECQVSVESSQFRFATAYATDPICIDPALVAVNFIRILAGSDVTLDAIEWGDNHITSEPRILASNANNEPASSVVIANCEFDESVTHLGYFKNCDLDIHDVDMIEDIFFQRSTAQFTRPSVPDLMRHPTPV